MKKLVSISFIFFILLFYSCEKIIYEELPPQLEITILDIDENPVSNADVYLLSNEDDWITHAKDEGNPRVDYKSSGSNGKVLFTDLEETIYFFWIEKDEATNFYSTATLKKPLTSGEQTQISVTIN